MQSALAESIIVAALFCIAAPLLVEWVGYAWHRFVEHGGYLGDRLRFRHWMHHERLYPLGALLDKGAYRDAHSWTWYALGAVVSLIVFSVLPASFSIALVLGFVCYGICVIESLHRAFHIDGHWLERFRWFKECRRLHFIHHRRNLANYGIAFYFLDRAFGTFHRSYGGEKQNLFPGYSPPASA